MLDQVAATGAVSGISHVILGASNLIVARDFYDAFGLAPVGADIWPDCGANFVYRLPSGQYLIIAEGAGPLEPDLTAAHVGLAVSPSARGRIVRALAGSGHKVFDYHEDDPVEARSNYYVYDPDGNRLQLVDRDGGEGVTAIDHVALEVSDIIWAEAFYGTGLDWSLKHRVGWNTQDYLTAKAKGEAGVKESLPGSRYVNERYSQFEKERRAIRPSPQIYLDAGAGCTVAVYLASRHYKAPPDNMYVGVPRLGLKAKAGLDAIMPLLEAMKLPSEGPVVHATGSCLAESLYVRDQGGNFIEFAKTA